MEQEPGRHFDPAHDYLQYERKALNAIFNPQSVAVIGATEKAGSVGRTILWNLISSPFGGTVFPINPKRSNVLGIKAYPSIHDVPDPVDLAVIVTPAPTVPDPVPPAPPSNSRSWPRPTAARCASSVRTAWAS